MNEVERELLAPGSRPEVPDFARRILDLSRDPNAELVGLPALVHADPALASRILQLFNSNLFHVQRGVHSLREAVLNLGLSTVRNFALSLSVLADLARPREVCELRDMLLRMALLKALVARGIAEETGSWRPDEAFLAGYISQAGCFFLQDRVSEYATVLRCFAHGEAELIELEQPSLRTDHGRMGVLLLRTWRVPGELLAPIAESFALLPPNQVTAATARRARLLRAADVCARTLAVPGFRGEAVWLKSRMRHQVKLEPDRLEALLRELGDGFWDAAGYFEIPAEGQPSYEDLVLQTDGIPTPRGHAPNAKALERVPPVSLERDRFEHLLSTVHRNARATRRSLALLVLSLEPAKLENIDPGFETRARDGVASSLSSLIRSTDANGVMSPGRFAVLAPGCEAQDLVGVAERLRHGIESALRSLDPDGDLDVAIGMAAALPHLDAASPEALLEAALAALDTARQAPDRTHLVAPSTR